MFLLDDILLSPVNGFVWLCRQIENAALKETEITPDMISAELSQLYMMLETEQISPEEFDTREAELLDLLDELQANAAAENDEDEDFEFDEELFDEDDADDETEEDDFELEI
jgi:hypothetical protein